VDIAWQFKEIMMSFLSASKTSFNSGSYIVLGTGIVGWLTLFPLLKALNLLAGLYSTGQV
jgi:hypothetical protein